MDRLISNMHGWILDELNSYCADGDYMNFSTMYLIKCCILTTLVKCLLYIIDLQVILLSAIGINFVLKIETCSNINSIC